MIHVSAGSPSPILVVSDVADTVATLVRVSDVKYWDGTDWSGAITSLPTEQFIPGVRKYTIPELDIGYYYLRFSKAGEIIHSEQIYAGGYLYSPSLQTCVVYGSIKDITGEPVQNSRVHFEPVEQFINGIAMILSARTAYTDINGEFAVEIVRNANVIITIEATAFRKRVVIPDKAMVSIEEL